MRLLAPFLVAVGIAGILIVSVPPLRLLATLVSPTALDLLATLSLVLLAWRSFAVIQAFSDGRHPGRPSPGAVAGLSLVLGFVALPHLVGHVYIGAADDAFGRFFAGSAEDDGADLSGDGSGIPVPGPGDRLNVLLIGVDKTEQRAHALTDTILLASLDPVGRTVSLISIPRDVAMVPLGNGDVYGPKINSLYSYAATHPDEFPSGPTRTLQDAIGALLDTDVHYYARIDMDGFRQLVDVAGGVTVDVRKGFFDPSYGFAKGVQGWGIEAGVHHLDGREALAFVRSRKAPGESDFTRAARQQQVLVALYRGLLADGSLLFRLPDLLDAFGGMVKTDVPPARLPDLAAIADGLDPDAVTSAVLEGPLLKPMKSEYGNVWVPREDRIAALTAAVLTDPGTPPTPWPPTR